MRAKNETALEMERVLLATMMLRPADCWRVDVSQEHFVGELHGEIFKAIRELSAESAPSDPVSVCDYFERSGRKELGGLALSISSATVTTAMPDAYAQRLVAGWRQRKSREIGASLIESTDPKAVDTAITDLMALHATEQKHEFSAKEAARTALNELNRIHESGGKLSGVTTGLIDLDESLGGLHKGDLIVVGARMAMGKTAFLIGLAKAAAASGAPVGMISGEQPVEQVALRMVSAASRLDAKIFRTAKFDESEWGRVFGGFETIAKLPMWFFDRSAPTMGEIARVARRWKHQHGIKALYVDYLQRIVCEGEHKHEQIGNAARQLKNLARDLEIPVIALSQIKRDDTGVKVKTPTLNDLAGSDDIGREADQVLMLYREGYYDTNAPQGTASVIIEKNRHGPVGKVDVSWQGRTMTFDNAAREYDAI